MRCPPPGVKATHALHPDLLILDQPVRVVLRFRHRRTTTTLRPPQRPSTRSRPPQMDHGMKREPQTIHPNQIYRTDPQIPQTTSTTNGRRRTHVLTICPRRISITLRRNARVGILIFNDHLVSTSCDSLTWPANPHGYPKQREDSGNQTVGHANPYEVFIYLALFYSIGRNEAV